MPSEKVEHETLAAALVAALAELTIVAANRTAKIPTKDGGKYEYDYADIGDVVKLTRPVLAEHGLVALTPVHAHDNGLACTVKIIHAGSDGVLDLGPFPFPHGRDAQATGSMVTYHRRYALVAALGMAAGDDDDGASAAKAEPEKTYSAAHAKHGVLTLLEEAGIVGAKEHAAEVWKQMFGDEKRPITQPEWERLEAATRQHAADLKAMEPSEQQELPA